MTMGPHPDSDAIIEQNRALLCFCYETYREDYPNRIDLVLVMLADLRDERGYQVIQHNLGGPTAKDLLRQYQADADRGPFVPLPAFRDFFLLQRPHFPQPSGPDVFQVIVLSGGKATCGEVRRRSAWPSVSTEGCGLNAPAPEDN
jgi:hypothetical protein